MRYATGTATRCVIAKLVAIRERGALSFAMQTIAASGLVFTLFEILPHFTVGVSEVHFVLRSTLSLLFGAAPAAFGLALGLLLQGVLFVPTDRSQNAMNATTLLVPLFAVRALAKRLIPSKATYRDLQYSNAIAFSTAYQSAIVVSVAFWALYGVGFGAANLGHVASFAVFYAVVVALVEPVADLAVLALAKQIGRRECEGICRPSLLEGMLLLIATMAAMSPVLLKRCVNFAR
nr:energy-coupling factor ABC transporter permease [Bradyrhizobium sp. 138]